MTTYNIGASGDLQGADGGGPFPDYDLNPLAAAPGVSLIDLPRKPVLLANDLKEFDAVILLGERIERASLEAGGRLIHIARMGVGYDTIDVPACTDHDVVLTIAPDGVRRAMAVANITLMLALAGRLIVKDRISRQGPAGWATRTRYHGTGLEGRTYGSIGMGNIGAEMFRLAQPFGMRLIAHDPFADAALATELGVQLVDLETVFRDSDFLACNCPLMAETTGIVNGERLRLMKPTAYLINASRGPVVDQEALYAALTDGTIQGAGLDVLRDEPPAADDPLLQLDNVIFAPHALGWNDQMFAHFAEINMAAIEAVKAGRVPKNVVNAEVLEKRSFQEKLKILGAK